MIPTTIILWLTIFISISLCLFYLSYITDIKKNWLAIPYFSEGLLKDDILPTLAIIVAARDEEAHIEACVQSILKNNYPRFELIVIDDHSRDKTLDILRTFDDSRLKILSQQPGLMGKKSALEYGISSTEASLIVTIDADCIVNEKYIDVLVSKYIATNYNAMAGPIKIVDEDTIISSFQQLDASGTMAVNAYGILKNKYYLSNGANFSFTKESFIAVDGYKGNDHLASGDDLFLIQKIAALPESKIEFLKAQEALVLTVGQQNTRDLLVQRKRWASKSRAYQDKGLKALLVSVFLFHFFILLNLALSFFLGIKLLCLSLIMLLLKMLVDYFFLNAMTEYFGTENAMRHYIIASLLSTGVVVYSGLIGIFPSTFTWKGRKLK